MTNPLDCERAKQLPPETLRTPMTNLNVNNEKNFVRRTLKAKKCRFDQSLVTFTKKFMDLVKAAPDGVLDLNEVATMLGVPKRRLYDITSVLHGVHLIRKRSKNVIQWIGSNIDLVSGKARAQQSLEDELFELSEMEEALDELIKECACQLFELTDDKETAKLAYVTYQDIRSIQTFQEQIVIAIKAPEETILEIPIPKEDCIEVHVKSTKGPIDVYLCEVEQGKSGAKTCEDMDTVTSETEPSVPPMEVRSPGEEKINPLEMAD
ncbi:transcription factor E2F6 isoform X2 [Calypte anna]|uniref:transcription factor E2F6 isoform X2 n=1 Tax=Calypte anna TaxID=9244 RepID=UPI0011C36D4C|nr:transcription factor E2F6 isoform X2 [Calypte anna]